MPGHHDPEGLLGIAHSDYQMASNMLDASLFPDRGFGFYAQQCAEKAIKVWILRRDGTPPYIHNLEQLLGQLFELDPDAQRFFHLKDYTPYATQIRYDADLETALPFTRAETLTELDKLLKHVASL